MAARVPNLFGVDDDARWWYGVLLSQFETKRSRAGTIVDVCRAIRAHAKRAGCQADGLFTYHHEIDALCALGDTTTRGVRRRGSIVKSRANR